jgi:uncharacterized protein
MHDILSGKFSLFIPLLKKNNVAKTYTFGSVLTGRFNSNSNIDFLISFHETLSPVENGENWFSLYHSLKTILNRDIGLLSEEDIKSLFLLKTINSTKQLIYG